MALLRDFLTTVLRDSRTTLSLQVGVITFVIFAVSKWVLDYRRGSVRQHKLIRLLEDKLKTGAVLLGDHTFDKITRMASNEQHGLEYLQVVSDFDLTLTKFKDENGDRFATTHGVLETSSKMPSSFREDTKQLKAYYFPLEFSPTLTNEEKAVLMDEWWERVHEKLVRVHLKESDLPEMVTESNLTFRTGAGDLLNFLHAAGVPLRIVSAGIADILREAIVLHLGRFNNMSIISNTLQFDSNGVLSGVTTPPMHSYNKGKVVARECDFENSTRPNVILLGDSLGDVQMVPHESFLPPGHVVLRIGFLNDPSSEVMREKYARSYDIVLLGDGDLLFVNELLRVLTA